MVNVVVVLLPLYVVFCLLLLSVVLLWFPFVFFSVFVVLVLLLRLLEVDSIRLCSYFCLFEIFLLSSAPIPKMAS
jgi:hypothetical protein